MIVLPAILDKVRTPEGLVSEYHSKKDRFIPDDAHADFWQALYAIILQTTSFETPVRNLHKKINPYFGYFGTRWHPEVLTPDTFHTGIDIEGRRKSNVYAIADGVLEYSGYGLVNGKYLMMSHPSITTEDGFVLHSLYIHLHACTQKFTSYQKMLRQISMNTYPIIPIQKGDIVGTIGKTGESSYPEAYTHVHVQVEFRDTTGRTVFLDPMRLFGVEEAENMTATCSEKQFRDMYHTHRKDIIGRKLNDIWDMYNQKLR
jgi:murein DD-endopeptidase MepM/ murein hydrolase activator NlpD